MLKGFFPNGNDEMKSKRLLLLTEEANKKNEKTLMTFNKQKYTINIL